MERLIDANKLKDIISDTWILDRIDEQPTIDPVKHGHWKGKPIAGCSTVRCSKCGDVFMENNGKWNYCPNCGAKMNGVEDETD